ncbi:hypothetical protein L1887_49094 [Cichorium endivia]|nr:hypothetical protein L1887_49094 [Cichorium endivia]
MSLPAAAKSYLSLIATRRSTYTLAKEPSILNVDQIHSILSSVLEYSPSSFNCKSPRLVLLLGADHDEYWGTTIPNALTSIMKSHGAGEEAIKAATGRLAMFKPAFGTVVFFESSAVVEEQQKNMPQYKDNFPIWSEHATGIAQTNAWSALTNAGYGANLQHYANLGEQALKEKYNLPSDWKPKAELVFGAKTAEPQPKEYNAEEENKNRLHVFGSHQVHPRRPLRIRRGRGHGFYDLRRPARRTGSPRSERSRGDGVCADLGLERGGEVVVLALLVPPGDLDCDTATKVERGRMSAIRVYVAGSSGSGSGGGSKAERRGEMQCELHATPDGAANARELWYWWNQDLRGYRRLEAMRLPAHCSCNTLSYAATKRMQGYEQATSPLAASEEHLESVATARRAESNRRCSLLELCANHAWGLNEVNALWGRSGSQAIDPLLLDAGDARCRLVASRMPNCRPEEERPVSTDTVGRAGKMASTRPTYFCQQCLVWFWLGKRASNEAVWRVNDFCSEEPDILAGMVLTNKEEESDVVEENDNNDDDGPACFAMAAAAAAAAAAERARGCEFDIHQQAHSSRLKPVAESGASQRFNSESPHARETDKFARLRETRDLLELPNSPGASDALTRSNFPPPPDFHILPSGRGPCLEREASSTVPTTVATTHRHAMDLLKAEIAAKRKAAAEASSASTSAAPAPAQNKYIRRGDLDKLREEHQRSASPSSSPSSPSSSRPAAPRSSPPANKRLKATHTDHVSRSASPSASNTLSAATKAALDTAAGEVEREKFNVSNDEAVRRLRSKGEPIRLFGESDKERRLRLRALELIEEKGGGVLGQNDFRNALQSAESATALELLEKRNAANKGKTEQARLDSLRPDAATDATDGDGASPLRASPDAESSKPTVREGVGMNSVLDLGLIKTDIDRVYPIIYYTLKGLLQEWADSLAARPDEVKHTMQGKLAAATQVQSADYLKPLFKKLRRRALTPDVLMRIAEIVHYVQKREYRHANDSYLQLSIGNAPWPIGVTMVGIHERSGREKIFSSNVAHVLNDEVSRKYIQSLKRLMTFAQSKYPPEDISMMMG